MPRAQARRSCRCLAQASPPFRPQVGTLRGEDTLSPKATSREVSLGHAYLAGDRDHKSVPIENARSPRWRDGWTSRSLRQFTSTAAANNAMQSPGRGWSGEGPCRSLRNSLAEPPGLGTPSSAHKWTSHGEPLDLSRTALELTYLPRRSSRVRPPSPAPGSQLEPISGRPHRTPCVCTTQRRAYTGRIRWCRLACGAGALACDPRGLAS